MGYRYLLTTRKSDRRFGKYINFGNFKSICRYFFSEINNSNYPLKYARLWEILMNEHTFKYLVVINLKKSLISNS